MGSPIVTTKEQDFSKSIQSPTTGVGGYVGVFHRGAIFQRVRVSQEREFVTTFGKPNETNYKHFFTVQNFLQYANALDVVRVVKNDSLCAGIAVVDGTSALDAKSAYILNWETYTPTFSGSEELQLFAKDPGTWGNYIKIAIANYADFATANIITGVSFASQFEHGPEASDEIAIAVIDNTDGNNTILEKYVVSLTLNSKDANGNNNYIVEKINGKSANIIAYLKTGTTNVESFEATSLSGGSDGTTISDTEVSAGYDLFADKENVAINYLTSGGNESVTARKKVDAIAEARKDITAYIGAKEADIIGVSSNDTIVNNIVADVATLAINSSYAHYFGNYSQVYDAYNDKMRWIPIVGEILGLRVSVNANNESWYPAAGFNRGILKVAQKLGFSPNQTQRDTLYNARINPIYIDTGAGMVVLGQKTMLASSSSFNRINTRELFIYCEKAIATFARDFLFEFNDVTTRNLFKVACDQFLRDVQSRRGIADFKVVCDETNNTAQVISNNGFVADVAIKANPVAEFITLNFFNVGAGVDFNEVV